MGLLYADVIVDLQFGDTGKGKVAHALAASNDYDMVLRYNGGANAGHTVYHNGQKVVTHQVPVGVLYGKKSVIGTGCVVNIKKLEDEIRDINNAGFDTAGLIFIDKRAHVVTDAHLDEDGADTAIGTTRQGIGPAYRDKYGRKGIRMEDLGIQPSELFEVIDVYKLLHEDYHKYRVLCEGAQGFHLDIDWGDYPYVTSSHCTIGSALLNGIPPKKIRQVIGTMKAYETYVGNKTYYTDENNPIFQEIQQVGNEFGATTGRPRKVNWMNLDRVIMAANMNGITRVIISKIDVLREVNHYGVIYDGERVMQFDDEYRFKNFVEGVLQDSCNYNFRIVWSETPHGI
jgi:adenylosuccinate synthase